MKTIGIGADNYKLDEFKKELKARGFTNLKVFSITKNSSVIKLEINDDQIDEISNICKTVEINVKRAN